MHVATATKKHHKKNAKNHSKSISQVIKRRRRKRVASQASQKRIFYNFWLPKGIQKLIKIEQKALTIIDGNHFWALRVAIYRCGALRTRFWTDLGRIWKRFWTNLEPILDNFWNIKPFKEQHHITWHTYIHTCIHFATTNRLGQAECAKRLNPPPPACQGSSSVLNSGQTSAIWQLTDLEHLPGALRIPPGGSPRRSNRDWRFLTNSHPKSNAVLNAFWYPPEAISDGSGSQNGAKMEPKWSWKWDRKGFQARTSFF